MFFPVRNRMIIGSFKEAAVMSIWGQKSRGREELQVPTFPYQYPNHSLIDLSSVKYPPRV